MVGFIISRMSRECDVKSWGGQTAVCDFGDGSRNCAKCPYARNYMNLMGPGTFVSSTDSIDYVEEGNKLVAKVVFNDGDPVIYRYTVNEGVFHLENPRVNNHEEHL